MTYRQSNHLRVTAVLSFVSLSHLPAFVIRGSGVRIPQPHQSANALRSRQFRQFEHATNGDALILHQGVGTGSNLFSCSISRGVWTLSWTLRRALIEWLLVDALSTDSNRIFRELWVMALHDQFVARAIDDFYDKAIEQIAQLLSRSYRGLSKTSADAIAHLLVSITEGSGVLYGTRQTLAVGHADTTALAVEVLTAAVRGADH